jgi:hypothetical protein
MGRGMDLKRALANVLIINRSLEAKAEETAVGATTPITASPLSVQELQELDNCVTSITASPLTTEQVKVINNLTTSIMDSPLTAQGLQVVNGFTTSTADSPSSAQKLDNRPTSMLNSPLILQDLQEIEALITWITPPSVMTAEHQVIERDDIDKTYSQLTASHQDFMPGGGRAKSLADKMSDFIDTLVQRTIERREFLLQLREMHDGDENDDEEENNEEENDDDKEEGGKQKGGDKHGDKEKGSTEQEADKKDFDSLEARVPDYLLPRW